jgi:hypothetical protein
MVLLFAWYLIAARSVDARTGVASAQLSVYVPTSSQVVDAIISRDFFPVGVGGREPADKTRAARLVFAGW